MGARKSDTLRIQHASVRPNASFVAATLLIAYRPIAWCRPAGDACGPNSASKDKDRMSTFGRKRSLELCWPTKRRCEAIVLAEFSKP
ncbi:unnamed protein product [Dibothriocephalus latus]|uniref:Uncharacterized protein n=1 Tax=Dibothriocephalus latus TaxID=60516 RepID=A0A3P7KW51_DIBLA|nr:unnamed protein product [Dibothriocephalus latus]